MSTKLSNTATPRYYGEFREKVIRGQIPVCKEISQEMNRIDQRIADRRIYYSPTAVEGFINFCEAEMTKTDGSRLIVLDTFKLWAEQLFGWWYFTTEQIYVNGQFEEVVVLRRLINKQYLIVARGGAKTMYSSFIQAYFLIINGETTHQITTAPTMIQAEEVLHPIRTAIVRSPGPVVSFLTAMISGSRRTNVGTMLASTKKGIESFITGSLLEVRPMSISKLQGLRPLVATVDEWLSVDIREDVVGAIEQGASKLDNYIIVATTSEGTIRNGSGDDIKLELTKILNGEYDDPHTSIFHYKLDSVDEVGDPKTWIKAQPNIGITVTYETYYKDVKRAESAPSARNDILAKRFGIPMEGYTYFFTYNETLPHPPRSYTKMACSMGADLSQGDDFCSFTFMFPVRDGSFGIKSLSFITEKTLHGLTPTVRDKYERFISEGSLSVLSGTVLDMNEVFYALDEFIQRRDYIVECVGYDPYNSETFVKRWTETYGSYGLEVVRQGVRTESVPLGQLKDLSEERLLLFDEEIFQFAMGNTMVLEDNNGNRKLYKIRYENKIDPVSALMDAYVAYSRNLNLFE